jgi:hypothetical protein
MKTYREFLAEEQDTKSLFNALFYREGPPLILTPSLLKRIQMSIPNVTAYHITEPSYLERLIKAQNTNASISASIATMYTKDSLYAGIETSGGMAVELEGTALLRSPADAFTARLKGGRRSVPVSADSDFFKAMGGTLPNEVFDKVEDSVIALNRELVGLIVDSFRVHTKWFETTLKQMEEDEDPKIKELGLKNSITLYLNDILISIKANSMPMGHLMDQIRKTLEDGSSAGSQLYAKARKELGVIMQSIVKNYMDGMEKILASDKSYKMIIMSPITDVKKYYDEVVLNKFRIKALSFKHKNSFVDFYTELAMRDRKEKENYDRINTAGKDGLRNPTEKLINELYMRGVEYLKERFGITRNMIINADEMIKRMAQNKERMVKVFT